MKIPVDAVIPVASDRSRTLDFDGCDHRFHAIAAIIDYLCTIDAKRPVFYVDARTRILGDDRSGP
jgi:hypothetical protein